MPQKIDPWIFTAAVVGAHHVMSLFGNLFLAAVYHYDLFPSRSLYKERNIPPRQLTMGALRDLLIASLVTQPLATWFLLYPVCMWRGMQYFPPVANVWLAALYVAAAVIVAFILNDIFNYWTHRMLHHRWFYKPIHKKHHLFTNDCVGLTSEYNHPVEQVISTLCTLVPIVLLGLDLVSASVFLFFRTWEVLDEHCGYRFPSPFGSEHSRRHDFHHARSGLNNLGMFRFWDWLLGTDKNYKAYLKKMKETALKQP
ncbi:MAG: sterol desaturase family protein [Turneriella sp.]